MKKMYHIPNPCNLQREREFTMRGLWLESRGIIPKRTRTLFWTPWVLSIIAYIVINLVNYVRAFIIIYLIYFAPTFIYSYIYVLKSKFIDMFVMTIILNNMISKHMFEKIFNMKSMGAYIR